MATELTDLHHQILQALEENPEGLSIHEIREVLDIPPQQHFDRRMRELYPYFEIERKRRGKDTTYRLIGPKEEGTWEYAEIPKDVRAKVLALANGQCQMCGKTISEDKIKLEIDHRIPQSWGGGSEAENLWAICAPCNHGKKNYFSSFNAEEMKEIMNNDSPHWRILNLLRLRQGEWVRSDLIQFVACALTYQDDWKKRLRELRYFGLRIRVTREKVGQRWFSKYKLENWVAELPDNLSAAARNYEVERVHRNKQSKENL